MRLTVKDAMATLFVLAAAVLYALWVNGIACRAYHPSPRDHRHRARHGGLHGQPARDGCRIRG